MSYSLHSSVFFFFNDTATTEIYTLSLHDALPLSTDRISPFRTSRALSKLFTVGQTWRGSRQRKSPTRGPEAPPATAKGRCSSLGESGGSSRCPSTRQVGTPASADTALCPASQM